MPDDRKTDLRTAPSRSSESLRNWLDVIAKLIGAVAIAGVTWVGYNYQSKASLSSVLNQREQAESQLRASMLGDLVEPIMGKNGAGSENVDLGRQRLLAEMVTLNFHDHFEFKPLLQEVDNKLLEAHDDDGHHKVASDARRVIDRQINMLTSIDGIARSGAAYPARTTRIDLVSPAEYESLKRRKLIPPPNGACRAEERIRVVKPSLASAASICVPSPDDKVCLLLDLYSPDYDKKVLSMTTFIFHADDQRSRNSFWPWIARPAAADSSGCNPGMKAVDALKQNSETLDEARLSIFDFPLTDNSKIMRGKDEYRYSVSLYYIDKPGENISLKIVWFPQGYVTERERPSPRFLKLE